MSRLSRPAIAGLSALLMSPAHATEPDSWTPEIIVTARPAPGYTATDAAVLRSPVPLLDTPQSVQVLTDRLLREQDRSTLADALRNISGAIPALPSEAVLANPLIRGFEAEIFTDGLIGYGDTAVIDPSSLWAVERIEVAKGPTSVLFGGGTGAPLGGLINLVSRTPEAGLKARAELRGGSFGLWQGRGDLNWGTPDAGFRLLGEYTRNGDPIDAVTIDRYSLNPSARVAIGDRTDLILRGAFSRVAQLEYAGLPAEIARLPQVADFRFSGATDAPRTTIRNMTLDAVLSHRFTDALSATVQARRYESRFDEQATFPFLAVFPLTGTRAFLFKGRLPVAVDESTVDASLTARFTTGTLTHTLLAGVTHDSTHYRGAIGFAPLGSIDYADPRSDIAYGAPPATRPVTNRYLTDALYLQNQIAVGPLNLLAALRTSSLGLREITGGAGTNRRWNRWDPRLGATLALTPGVNLFAGWAQGSRLTLFYAGSTPPVPETSDSVEAGVKLARPDLGLSGTLAGFRITRRNVPTADPLNPFTQVQSGEQRSRGVEADLIWEPTPAVSLLASYAFTRATVSRDTSIPVGNRLPRVPEHSGRIAARYRLLDGPLQGLGIGAGLTAASAAEITLPNRLRGDSWAVVDAQASYQVGRVRLAASVENLFDHRYFIPYQYLGQAVLRPGDPRTATLTIGVTY
ncbi:TonB-dependent siderophore receptor [Sandaracinobacteroides saxicola]|uniref:TonB-dependent siderophore receptor n=1 Tax=Sandaracinobacteroides saxicola TaxID=2759707 RepID=A0A7G5ILS8_9SPHN|nr:TonB-dependent siderophore receptor [Sandaracinobacteroides saxicola]QMW24320.1 TonB-dependent siderophore receptor [Sandaracinobacteroides saxicola]